MSIKTQKFDSEYVSKDYKIPYRTYLNKVLTGCGITTVALTNEENVILAVPNVELVINKSTQLKDILPVYGETSKEEIDEYAQTANPIKIIVTYDSLKKVEFLLPKCRLLIDECDQLFCYSIMKAKSKKVDIDVINQVLGICEKEPSTTFISATPIEMKYLPKWFERLDILTFEWENTIKVKPIRLERSYPFKALVEEVINPIQANGSVKIADRIVTKAIIFINSISQILNIIERSNNLPLNDCGIICGDNIRNDSLLGGLKRIREYNKLPKFTFITGSGFRGIDLYDPEAITIIVSNCKKDWQMLDYDTDIKQIIGRQRIKTNPNRDRFIFIYNKDIYNISKQELLDNIQAVKRRLQNNCKTINESTCFKDNETTFLQSEEFATLCNKVDGKYQINELVFSLKEYRILETLEFYRTGFKAIDCDLIVEPPKKQYESHKGYKDILERYKSNSCSEEDKETKAYELIDRYFKEFNSYSNDPQYIRDRLNAKDKIDELKILIKKKISPKKDYTRADVKKILQSIYDQQEIKRKASYSDLNQFGEVSQKTIKGERYVQITYF